MALALSHVLYALVVIIMLVTSCAPPPPDGPGHDGGGAHMSRADPTIGSGQNTVLTEASATSDPRYYFTWAPRRIARTAVQGRTIGVEIEGAAVRIMPDEAAPAWLLELRLAGVGRPGRLSPPPSVRRLSLDRNRATLERGDGFSEWYEAGPAGLEQGLTIDKRPAGEEGTLVLKFEAVGLRPRQLSHEAIIFQDAREMERARYTDLHARDSEGTVLRATMRAFAAAVEIVIDDEDARYPVDIDPLLWVSQQKLTASASITKDFFGRSVSVSGSTAVVGTAPYGISSSPGSAYVFFRSGGMWTEQQKLTASDAAPTFGYSVDIDVDTAIIGGGDYGSGAAYVFVRTGGTWTEEQKLTASDGVNIGNSVAVSGDVAVVGAWGDDNAGEPGAGSAYVFVRSGGIWTEQQKLGASDAAPDANFGSAVSVDADTALVAAYNDSSIHGAVYVFVNNGGVWTQQQKLTASFDPAGGLWFGRSVSLDGDTAVIGRTRDQYYVGGAYIFVREEGVWVPQQKLTASDGAADDLFGHSASVSGNMVTIGSVWDDPNGTESGSAYVFVRSGGTWNELQKLTAFDGSPWDQFGSSVAMSGDAIVVGADRSAGAAGLLPGKAYAFVLVGTPCLLATDCGSGFCADEFCCDKECTGACDACNLPGSEGTCTELVSDPGNPSCSPYLCDGTGASCPTSCTSDLDCVANHYCDGSSCEPDLPNGADCAAPGQCQTGYCANGFCCDTACTGSCAACDVPGKDGTCSPFAYGDAGSPSCAPYSCNGASLECPTSCTDDWSCSANAYCDVTSATCKWRLGLGQSCMLANACLSGHCADGFCCDSACSGACASCNLVGFEGTCAPVAHGTAGDPTCTPFPCDGMSTDCPAACTSDAQCTPDEVCDMATGLCSSRSSCDCAPLRCTDAGTCASRCESAADCLEGLSCDTSGACVAQTVAAKAAGEEGACACRHAGQPVEAPRRLLLLALAVILRRYRRRPRCNETSRARELVDRTAASASRTSQRHSASSSPPLRSSRSCSLVSPRPARRVAP